MLDALDQPLGLMHHILIRMRDDNVTTDDDVKEVLEEVLEER